MKLGQTDIAIGKIAFGCWRFSGHDVAKGDRLIRTALDAGMNLIDTADIYGLGKHPNRDDKGFGQAEQRLGEVLTAAPNQWSWPQKAVLTHSSLMTVLKLI